MFITHHIIKSLILTVKKKTLEFFPLLKQVKKKLHPAFCSSSKDKPLLPVLRLHKQLTHSQKHRVGVKPQCKHKTPYNKALYRKGNLHGCHVSKTFSALLFSLWEAAIVLGSISTAKIKDTYTHRLA